MGRPHIEFVQSQWLPWTSTTLSRHLGGTTCRLLSGDAGTGSATLLVRFPPGWIRRDSRTGMDEEIYVLDGALAIDERVYPADYHAHLPAGFPRAISESRDGAVALVFLTSPPPQAAPPPPDGYDHTAWIGRTDIFAAIWPAIPAGWNAIAAARNFARMRVLRDGKGAGQTLVLGYPPNWQAPFEEKQRVDAEYYLLAGRVTLSGVGVMQPGAYIWRPAGTMLPPMAGKEGAVFLIRSHGGDFATEPGRQSAVQCPEKPQCVLPAEIRQRIVAGPYAA